jgi:omega-amidase
MSNSAFTAKPFRLTLIQLGGVGEDKTANLAHAKEMVKKAVQPVDGKKTDLVVLPVSLQNILQGVVILTRNFDI